MDLQLTEDQLEFKKLARDFLEAEVVPQAGPAMGPTTRRKHREPA